MEKLVISKEEAINLNQKWYYSGIPCKNGHINKRYVNTGICYECKRNLNKQCNKRNPERQKRNTKSNYNKNKTKILKRSKTWVENNREKSNQYKNNWKVNHKEQNLKQARDYQNKQRKDPYKRVSMNMSKAIWECLKKNKNNTTWLSFVEFSIDDLIKHLENKFTTEMTWENYGIYWHIDHIKPLSWFNLETEFKDAWALSNLQPLEATKNLSKGNRYIG
jgi:hypothetical protein